MKKISVLVAVVGILFAFVAVSSFAEDAALTVTAKNGHVLVKTYPSENWTEITVGQVVHSKDVIKTDLCDAHPKDTAVNYVDAQGNACPVCGAATLALPDKSCVSIKPDSEASIDEIVLDNASRKLKVSLTKGEMRMIVAKVATPSEFSVKTPNAIFGATGTIYYTKATLTGASVYVADGSINAFNPIDGKTYTILAGMMMTFNADGTVVGPTTVSDVDVSNWTACYTDPVEPFTPVVINNPNVTPPENTPERPASGG